MSIAEAIQKGVAYLATHQNGNGSWGSLNIIGATGLALLKLESYAREIGYSPFDDEYEYSENVVNGLKFLFTNAQQDAHGVFFQEGGRTNYQTGIALAAICANAEPNHIVPTGLFSGQTFKFVAQNVVNYLTWSQHDSGVNIGGWAYNKGDLPDNSVSGYVTLGLEFAEAPSYNFACTIPASIKQRLNSWINYIQNDTSGGSGYSNPDLWVNILKTGNLIQQMHFYGDDLTSVRLNKATTYIADNWAESVCLTGCAGWGLNSIPSDYQATFTTMKGLSSYGIETITPTAGPAIDWFADMSNKILQQQIQATGEWPTSQWDTDPPILSTTWALLTLEKVVPPPSRIPFKNNITYLASTVVCPWDITQSIEVEGELKIFAHKYSHSESDCIPDTKPGKGDDIGFTLVFGNYGEFSYLGKPGIPTVEDTLYVQSPVNLRLMSLCLPDGFRLYNVTDDEVVNPCDKFFGDIPYVLQVQRFNGETYEPDFDIPCHSIFTISMLFQIEFPACPKCPEDQP